MTSIDTAASAIDRMTTSPGSSSTKDAGWTIAEHDDDVLVAHRVDAPPEPADWADRLAGYLTLLPNVQLVGAKRLSRDGTVFSFGEFLVHPKGFHHWGKGAPAEAFRFPEEVDAIAGGAFAVERSAFEAAGGAAMLEGVLGAIELSLHIRMSGGRCIAVPDVVVTDETTPEPGKDEARSFQQQWGFDWNAADLDVARRRWRGTGLLWNVRLHGRAMPFEKYDQRPAMHWDSYAKVDVYRKRADHLAKLVAQNAATDGGMVLDLGCGDGLFTHLMAQQQLEAIGIDVEASAIEQAKAKTRGQPYAGNAPQFIATDGGALPFEDDSMQAVAMFDVIEHLPNPIALLREVARVLKPSGALILSTPAWQLGGWSDPIYHVTEYTMDELTRQIRAAGFAVSNTGMIGGVYRDLIVIARLPAGAGR